jgi:5-methylthioadenosine/S-adenosylhomocysteine deaminase
MLPKPRMKSRCCVERTGYRHIEWLHALELLGPDMQLVHCVQITEEEERLIAEFGAVVVHCPTSNMYLASGIAPIPSLLQKGVPVALGTDGSASHNSQDLLETLKTAVLVGQSGQWRSDGDPARWTRCAW